MNTSTLTTIVRADSYTKYLMDVAVRYHFDYGVEVFISLLLTFSLFFFRYMDCTRSSYTCQAMIVSLIRHVFLNFSILAANTRH